MQKKHLKIEFVMKNFHQSGNKTDLLLLSKLHIKSSLGVWEEWLSGENTCCVNMRT